MCRNRSYDCQQLAERAPNARVRDVLIDIARTWTRLALEVEELRRENSPRNRLAKRDAANHRSRINSTNPLPLPVSPPELLANLNLKPIGPAAGSVTRSQSLRKNSLQPHLADMRRRDFAREAVEREPQAAREGQRKSPAKAGRSGPSMKG